ncbi:MAG: hypothetical protein ACD_12C00795G0001, partial [uncultured bacterium]
NLFIKNTATGNLINLTDISAPESSLKYSWETIPPSGNYLLYALINDWSGGTTKSNEVEVNIK